MKDNYKNGGVDYTTKTISQTVTVSLVSNTVKIEANKDSVVRSKPFSVTITGKPSDNLPSLGQRHFQSGRRT